MNSSDSSPHKLCYIKVYSRYSLSFSLCAFFVFLLLLPFHNTHNSQKMQMGCFKSRYAFEWGGSFLFSFGFFSVFLGLFLYLFKFFKRQPIFFSSIFIHGSSDYNWRKRTEQSWNRSTNRNLIKNKFNRCLSRALRKSRAQKKTVCNLISMFGFLFSFGIVVLLVVICFGIRSSGLDLFRQFRISVRRLFFLFKKDKIAHIHRRLYACIVWRWKQKHTLPKLKITLSSRWLHVCTENESARIAKQWHVEFVPKEIKDTV